MKKIKLFVVICVSFLLAALAAVGVFAATPITYTLEGTLEYEMTDAIVNITTTVYKSNVAQSTSEIEKTVNTISTNNTIPTGFSVVASSTLKQSGISKNFLDNFSIFVDDTAATYYMVVNIQNQVPSKNVWAWVDENTVFPGGASYISNNIQQNITSTPKNIVYGIKISGIDVSKAFQTKIKLGTGVLANQAFNMKKLTISGNSVLPVDQNISGTVIIPNNITTIPAEGFKDCTQLQNIILPTSLITIGESAFYGCTSLKSIDIPEGVTTIEDETFRNCSSLTKITIPNSLSYIEYRDPFAGCTSLNAVYISDFSSWAAISYQYGDYEYGPLRYAGNLYIDGELVTHFTVPTTVKSLSAGDLSYCTSLQEITFHSNMSSIGSDAFLGCTNLTKVNIASELSWLNISFGDYDANPLYYAHNLYKDGNLITEFTVPSSKTIVNDYQFAGASCLTNVVFQGTSCTIDQYAFYKCTGLTSIILPSSSRLYYRAFAECTNLTSVTLPSNLSTIESRVFEGCSSLTNISFSSNISTIEYGAFENCTALTRVDIPSIEAWLRISFNGETANPLYYAHNLYVNGSLLTEFTVPSSFTSIKSYTFSGCSTLTSVTIPSTVTSISSYAFSKCTGLTNVVVPNAGLGTNVFDGCTSLTNVTLPSSMTSISDYLFFGCTSLETITLPNSLSEIGSYAFKNCSALTNIILPNNVTTIRYHAFENCSSLASITMQRNITSIESSAFLGCSGLSRVNIINTDSWFRISFGDINSNPLYYAHNLYIDGNPVTEIITPGSISAFTSYQFAGFSGLTSITVPANISTIGTSAFDGCSQLKTLTIADSSLLTTINDNAFRGCTSLTSINLPSTVTSIGNSVFSGCANLQTINLPNGIPSVGNSLFNGCSSLKNITIPTSVSSIGSSAFYGCSSLESVNIPSLVTSIYDSTFSGCSSLTSIDIPNTITSISSNAFYNCSNLMSITIPNMVSNIYNQAFNGCNKLVQIKDLRVSSSNSVFPSNTDREYITTGDFVNSLQTEGNYYTYSVKDGDTVTKKYLMGLVNKNVTTLNDLDTYNITHIYSYACKDNLNLQEIIIPSTVQSIENNAFSGCTNVIKIKDLRSSPSQTNLPTSNKGCQYITTGDFTNSFVTEGNYITYTDGTIKYLYGVVDKTVTEINDLGTYGITSIYSNAFAGCSKLTSITIPNTVTSIENYAFANCTNLVNLSLPNTIISIGQEAFYNCSSLTNLTIPGSVTSFGSNLFTNCSNLKVVTIQNGLTTIPNNLFYNCSSLDSVTIPDSVTSIGENAFYYCSSLTNIILPNELTTIGNYAFYYCSKLTGITIPSSVTRIGSYAFRGCDNLISVNISSLQSWLNISFGNSYSNPLNSESYSSSSNIKKLYVNGSLLTNLEIPEGTTQIKSYAFYGYKSVTSITIPSSVTSIGGSAFYSNNNYNLTRVNTPSLQSWLNISFSDSSSNPLYYADNLYINGILLTNLEIPEGTTKIKDYAFNGCTSITSVTIQSGVTSIGSRAFYECKNINSVTIPSTVTHIYSYAFYDCTAISRINISDLDAWYNIYFSDAEANPMMYSKNLYLNGSLVSTSTIPEGATQIRSYQFSGMNLTSIVIPNGVTSIGDYAFYKCKNLTTVVIPNTVTSIGSRAFSDCDSLNNIIIPNSVNTIGSYAFYGCGLATITIPSSVTSLGGYVFYNCKSLTDVTIEYGLKSIPWETFWNCTSLKNVDISSSVTSIEGYAFEGCTGLNYIKIPKSVTSIQSTAFSGCINLTSIAISTNIKSISSSTFNSCSKLQTVYYEGTQEQFKTISIGSNNSYFTSATKVYNYIGESGWKLVEIITPATCTTTGVGKFTNFWGDTKEDSIPARHTSMVDGKCTECGVVVYNFTAIYGSFGFERNDEGIYVSNNRYIDSSVASARLTAISNMNLTIKLNVDSEKDYDKFKITVNGEVLDWANDVSGVYSGEHTISLSAGDSVVFTYTKDGSGSSVSDCVQFELC